MSESIEKGSLFLFYRNKVDVKQAKRLDDVQRSYVMLVPDGGSDARLLVIGRKRLPPIIAGKSDPRERQWMMILATGSPKQLAEELGPVKYETKTRGERLQGEAIPAAAARYAITKRDDSTFLAYRLVRPSSPGEAQEELGIQPDAAYVIAVRNPSVEVPGFPQDKPQYPKRLREKFADLRWLEISDAKLLDYEKAQLVLIGAREHVDELDVDLSGAPDLFETLGLDESAWPVTTLDKGEFCEARDPGSPSAPVGDRSAGGERGGRAAADAPSAAGVAKALGGISFPQDRAGLVDHARNNEASAELVDLLERLPKKKFEDMAEVEKAFSEVH